MNKDAMPNAKILWLENDTRAFDIAVKHLQNENYEVLLVSTLNAFKKAIKENDFDLVIIDIRGETFNGLELVKSNKIDFGDAKICILSGYLDDQNIQEVLENLEKTVFVLDKSYPFDDSVIEIGLESQLKNILGGYPAHTNSTYYSEADISDFDISKGVTTYEQYNQLNPKQKNFVKDSLLDLAESQIQKFLKQGFKSFLVCGPKGKVIKKSKTPILMSSEEISHVSLAQGYPCLTTTRHVRNEEIRSTKCKGMYEYYYSVKIKFSGERDEAYDIHFDTGSEASWFDLNFLKSCGIGLTGDMNNHADIQTLDGIKRVYYFSENREIAVYDQLNTQNFEFTTLHIQGLPNWRELSFAGFSDDPDEELCKKCRSAGKCLERIALIGQDLLRNPGAIKLTIDGDTGLTTPLGKVINDN